jgi:hypothetical protein
VNTLSVLSIEPTSVNWLLVNKEWVFSGAGVAAVGALIALFFRRGSEGHRSAISADRNSSVLGSPVASGSNISQTVNIVTTLSPAPQQGITYSDTPSPSDIRKQLRALPLFQRKAVASSYLGLKVRWKGTLAQLEELPPHYNQVSDSGDATHDLRLRDEGLGDMVRTYVNIERFPRLKISHEGTRIEIFGTISYVSDLGAIRLKDGDISV